MKKKLMVMAIAMVFAITSLAGCGEQKAETTTGDGGTVAEENANENSEGKVTEGENTALEMKEFANYAGCKAAVGFNFIVLPKTYNYKLDKISVLNDVVSIEMSFADDESVLLLLCTSEGEKKLATGIPEKTQEKDVLGINVTFGYGAEGTGYHLAEWTNNNMSYSMDSLGITDEEFESMVSELVDTTL